MTTLLERTASPALARAEVEQLTLRSTLTQLARNPGWGLFLQDGPHWSTFGAAYCQAHRDGLLTLWHAVGGRGLTITDKGRAWLRAQRETAGQPFGTNGQGELGGREVPDVSL